MAQLTKKERSAAAKKAAATRAKNEQSSGKRSSGVKDGAAPPTRQTAPELAKRLVEADPLAVIKAAQPQGVANPPNAVYEGTDVTKLKPLFEESDDDFQVVQLDGARAVLKVGKEEFLVDQAALTRASKRIAKAIQLTY